VIVNPFGGRKKGPALWEAVSFLFVSRGVPFRVVYSHYQGHSAAIASEVDLRHYSGLITVGGDGMLSEVFNALMHRREWGDIVTTPLGVIPAGTCNGLAFSTKQNEAMVSAFNILSSIYIPSLFSLFTLSLPRPH
jgi:sphingosine kinase